MGPAAAWSRLARARSLRLAPRRRPPPPAVRLDQAKGAFALPLPPPAVLIDNLTMS